MPSKKSTKFTTPVLNHDSDSSYYESSSDENKIIVNKKTKSAKQNTNVKDMDNDSISSNENIPIKKSSVNKKTVLSKQDDNDTSSDDDMSSKKIVNKKAKTTKKVKAVETLEDDSEDVENVSDSESESESETEIEDKKSKEKKLKESFDELSKKLDGLQLSIKTIDKDISEIEKSLKSKEKIRNDYERQRNSLLKLLSKTHNDEVTKARKEKPKRKSNVTGGFCKKHPVPDILIKFLELKEGETCLERHQVMSKLSNKFFQMGLKKGQKTTLNKEVVDELELNESNIGRVIEFGEFQTFLKGFYPNKEEKNIVSVN